MISMEKGIPEQFKNQPNMKALLNAFEQELNDLEEVFTELNTLRWFDTSYGKQMDGIGDIVVMSRKKAWELANTPNMVMDDEHYKLFLKWKALKNVTNCTFQQFCDACKLMFNPKYIYYKEDKRYPATMFVQLGTEIDGETIDIIKNSLIFIKPAGVALRVDMFELQFFGFSDTNENALGFGVGKFAQKII